jgi:hypothetical protein
VRGREKARSLRPACLAGAFSVALVLVLGATPAVAKRGKPKAVATTHAGTVALAAGATVTASASCTGKTHATGGGFAVSPPFVPPGTGVRSWTTTTNPVGPKTWLASGTAFTNPSTTGSFTTFARCEKNSLGRLAVTGSSAVTLSPGEFRTLAFECPANAHVISGGYAGDGPTAPNNGNGWRIDILQSQRTAPREWSISAFDRGTTPPAAAPATLTGFVVCEFNAKGVVVGQASVSTPLSANTRATADPSCRKKQHVVSGGFVITPLPGGPGSTVPVVSLDENQPVGNRGWHIGLHPWVFSTLPPGESLQATAYCKKDTIPKKK